MKRRRESKSNNYNSTLGSDNTGTVSASASPVHVKRLKTVPHAGENNEIRAVADVIQEQEGPENKQNNVVMVGQQAPSFEAEAVFGDGTFGKVDLEQFKGTNAHIQPKLNRKLTILGVYTPVVGRFVVLLFYPLDFTFVCPTELLAFSDKLEHFRAVCFP